MDVTLFMAQSINGYIARENGQEDFLSDKNWKTFQQLAEKTGCFIIGRKTYDTVMKWKEYNFDNINARCIILSKDQKFKPKPNYEIANSPNHALKKASSLGFKNALLTGGSVINSAFLKQNLISRIILNIEPYILGKGISLFAEENIQTNLELIKTTKISQNIIQLEYKVLQ
jgi:dihydrofolate reductase